LTDVNLAFDANNYLGETPICSTYEQSLYWINCEKPPQIHRWPPATGKHEIWPMPKRIGGFVPKAGGGLLVVLADGLYDFDTASQALSLRVTSPLADHVALHECHCDRQGGSGSAAMITLIPRIATPQMVSGSGLMAMC
jgi:L-arabinonolactonase